MWNLLFLIPSVAFLSLAACYAVESKFIGRSGDAGGMRLLRDCVMTFAKIDGCFILDGTICDTNAFVVYENAILHVGPDAAKKISVLNVSTIAGDFCVWEDWLLAVRLRGVSGDLKSAWSARDARYLLGIHWELIVCFSIFAIVGAAGLGFVIFSQLYLSGRATEMNIPAFNTGVQCTIMVVYGVLAALKFWNYRCLCRMLGKIFYSN